MDIAFLGDKHYAITKAQDLIPLDLISTHFTDYGIAKPNGISTSTTGLHSGKGEVEENCMNLFFFSLSSSLNARQSLPGAC